MSRTGLSILLLCFSVANAQHAKNQKEIENEIRDLESQLIAQGDILENTESKKSAIEDILKSNEKKISKSIKKIEKIEQNLKKNSSKIARLSNKKAELKDLKDEQQQYIKKQVRAAYEIGNEEFLKLILNQEDPNGISRLVIYYEHIIAARTKQITSYNNTLIELDRISADLAQERQSLKNNQGSLTLENSTLATIQRDNRETLASLIKLIRDTGAGISKLKKDRQHLEDLLSRIQNIEQASRDEGVIFSDMRGRMLLPVVGKVTETFGKRRSGGKLSWSGLFIEAEEGRPVYAIHYGKVIFSDWLRGFGLMTIISHGNGYMSLYGHNQVLYLETGDWVEAGDIIATVGNSGGQSQTGLYFEIRINGVPNDPEQWCIARNIRAA